MKKILNLLTNTIYELPILVMMPHSSCNCRCVMCDIWKANNQKKELSTEEIERHMPAFEKLKVREIVLSGGEALMHKNLFGLCRMFRTRKIKVTLLSTGLLLRKFADEIIGNVDEVIVSLDGSRDVHNKIRNIPGAFEKLADGVMAIKQLKPSFRVTGRCVLQKQNFRDFKGIVESAGQIGLDQISFLPADVSTAAFNHLGTLDVNDIALTLEEVEEFRNIIEEAISNLKCKIIAESPGKLRRLPDYYRSLVTKSNFKSPPCNAPWVSAVLESDGRLMPCFFHKEYGSVLGQGFQEILNSKEAIEFRNSLNVRKNPVCQRCVCSLRLPLV